MDELEYLKQSEIVRLVLAGKYTPKGIDNAFRKMKRRIREQEHTHILDMAQIVAYRRQIELLTEVGE